MNNFDLDFAENALELTSGTIIILVMLLLEKNNKLQASDVLTKT